jgi:integrase
VDFAHHTVRLEPGSTKNLEGRTFPFGTFPELASLLRERRELTRSLELSTGQVIPWVFASRQGRQISDFYGAWRAACRRAGVPGRIFHDFRRTAVRNLERAGVPRSIAMKLTGHKTEAVYRRYAIVSEADLAEGVAKLAQTRLVAFSETTELKRPKRR